MIRKHTFRAIGIGVVVLAFAVFAFSGGAAAQSDTGGQAGVCVIGEESPCNGEQWDGDPVDDGVGLPGDIPADVPQPGGDVPVDIPTVL